ncbi:MAG: site-2 protease family protein [Caldilineales bacterium]
MLFGRSQEETIALLIVLIPAFTLHEFAHAWSAYRLGDSTAKDMGRLTLNPLKHLDVLGVLLVLMVGFGWAKPVPVNPANLRNGRRDMALVALAGPMANLLMALAAAAIWRLAGVDRNTPQFLVYGLLMFTWLNVALMIFNLLPISPLDGFKVALGWLPEPAAALLAKTAQWGMLILFGLVLLGNLAARAGMENLDILGTLIATPTRELVTLLLGIG